MYFSMDLPDPGIEPVSPVFPALQADALPGEPSGKPWNQSGFKNLIIVSNVMGSFCFFNCILLLGTYS